MAVKQFILDGHLKVSIYKRRGVRSMRLSVVPNNIVRVTIPSWVTYGVGLRFAESKLSWIQDKLEPKNLLKSGQQIGKYHRLEFIEHSGGLKSRVTDMAVRIHYPQDTSHEDVKTQELAEAACLRALKAEAAKLLPDRLNDFAQKHGFEYNKVTIKRMKSRWGSCDTHKNIVLNQFLMQLPWELIDYVLLHELNHTQLMKHGPEFWQAMDELLPDTKTRRKAIKTHKPTLQTS